MTFFITIYIFCIIFNILGEAKAENITTIDLENKTSYADAFVIATCRSGRHADSTANTLIEKLKKESIICQSPEGRPKCDWVIIDVGSIIIHLFRPEIRKYYNLEKLWGMSFDINVNEMI